MKSSMPAARIRAGRICKQIGISHAASDCEAPVPPLIYSGHPPWFEKVSVSLPGPPPCPVIPLNARVPYELPVLNLVIWSGELSVVAPVTVNVT